MWQIIDFWQFAKNFMDQQILSGESQIEWIESEIVQDCYPIVSLYLI